MNVDLFNIPVQNKEIKCNVFHDERILSKSWLYHGYLFIPFDKEDKFVGSLLQQREKSTWNKELHFHKLNNTLTQNDLANRWLNLFCNQNMKSSYFYFFGVDLTKVDKSLWNDNQTRDFKIYNRFFQIGLYGALKWFFLNKSAGFDKVTIKNIYSDSKTRESEDNFHTKPIFEIGTKAFINDEHIKFENHEILEVDSDHEKEALYKEQSHIIQYVDLITGTFGQILDNTSEHQGKCNCAEKMLQNSLPIQIMEFNASNFKSVYYKKYGLSFFPKNKLSKKQIISQDIYFKKDQFYNLRHLAYANKNQGKLL